MRKAVSPRILTIKPDVIPGETATGFLHRAFSINGRRWDKRLLHDDGVDLIKLIHGDEHDVWDVYFGRKPGSFVAVEATSHSVSHVKIAGHALRRDDWSARDRRWCPACWKQDLNEAAGGRSRDWNIHHRFWWDVVAISHCPHHRIKLEANCPDCNRPIRWHRGSMTRCDKGHDLLTKGGLEVSAEDCEFDSYVLQRLQDADPSLNVPLHALDLADAIEVVERLGVAAIDEDAGVNHLRQSVGRGAIFSAGMAVVSGLPESIGPLLDRVIAGAPNRKRKWGVEQAYAGFHRWVRDLPDTLLAALLRDEMMKHAQGNVTFKTGGGVGGLQAPLNRVTFREAAEICGISSGRLRRIAVVLGLKAEEKETGKPTGMSQETVRELADRIKGCVNLDIVVKQLDIAPNALKNLVRAGIVKPIIPRTGRTGPGTWLFHGDVAAQLIAKLNERCVEKGPLDERWVSMAPAAQIMRTSLAAVMALVLDGKVPVRHEAGAGISAFHVPISTLKTQLRIKRWPGTTTAQFMKETGLPHGAVIDYIQNGIIAAKACGVWWILPEGETARFQEKYVTINELQNLMAMRSPKAIMGVLRSLREEPACPRPPYVKVLYHRATAIPAAHAWMARQAEKKRLKPQGKPGLTGLELANRLNWDRAMVRHLIGQRHIASHPGPVRYRVVPESEYERLKRDLVTATELAALVGKSAPMAIMGALRAAGIEAVHTMPDGRYAVYPRQPSVDAVMRFVAEQEAAREMDDGIERLDMKSSAAFLGLQDHMLLQLTRANLLPATRKGRAVLIAKSDLERFAADYVLGNELERLMGKSGGAASKFLKRNGVQPFLDRPPFYSVVFHRSQAIEAIQRGKLAT